MLELEMVGELPVVKSRVKPLLQMAGDYMIGSVQQNIDEGGRPPWPPLKFAVGPALYSSGALYRSGTKTVAENEVTVSFGGGLGIYPFVMQNGAKIKVTLQMKKFFWAKYMESNQEKWKYMALKKVGSIIEIDARTFVLFQDEDLTYLADLFQNYAMEIEGVSEFIGADFNRGISSGVL